MPTFLFLAAICLLVAASILLETDASPNKNTKLEKGSSSSGNAESTDPASLPVADVPVLEGNADAIPLTPIPRSCPRLPLSPFCFVALNWATNQPPIIVFAKLLLNFKWHNDTKPMIQTDDEIDRIGRFEKCLK
uniref:Secreted protein n=1 Tax=Globodera rostochiensis TaxID=31243 RepID=A0A914HBK0_GLORO